MNDRTEKDLKDVYENIKDSEKKMDCKIPDFIVDYIYNRGRIEGERIESDRYQKLHDKIYKGIL